jgi:hypothetical protein
VEELLAFTRPRCPELARALAEIAERPLSFRGDDPNAHSADNHVHLWALEWWAERHPWIDLDYRTRAAEALLARWRARLPGFAPWRDRGFRLYLYEDLAPTLSVVAETDAGFPYPCAPRFVTSARQIMALHAGRRWSQVFAPAGPTLAPADVLSAVAAHAGSIGAPTARALGLRRGDLRKLIEAHDLQDAVNALRKRHRRRPAVFRPWPPPEARPHMLEIRVPPRGA